MTTGLRVAVIGAGPAGLYATGHLLENTDYRVEVDLYERLPTPWGLVRAGVAPDHPEKKRVTDRLFEFILENPRVRFLGNVEVGEDITHSELVDWYDAVVYSVGASSDKKMNIKGEELSGCWSAREFVSWYNGHPDFRDLPFDLSCERALIVGNGNVSIDVARILTMPIQRLEMTDIADHALEALRRSAVREVVILGRRSFFQGAFHNPELEELEHLEDVDVVIEADELPGCEDQIPRDLDWDTRRKVATLRKLATLPAKEAPKRIVLRFLASPLELRGAGKVEQVCVVSNRLVQDSAGVWRAQATGRESLIDAGLVLRAIGYRGQAMPGLPFDKKRGVIANLDGRVTELDGVVPGTYVAGWIKRGPKGVIGSNKKCARDTVKCLFDDAAAGLLAPATCDANAVLKSLLERQPDLVRFKGWKKIDHRERRAGESENRPRVKLTNIHDMLCEAAL